MVRRRWQLDPELALVVRERLPRVLAGPPPPQGDDPVPGRDGAAASRPAAVSPWARPPAVVEDDDEPTLPAPRRLRGPALPDSWGGRGADDDLPVASGPRRAEPYGGAPDRWAGGDPDDELVVGPDALAPPRRFTRGHLAVVVVLLVLGLLWGGWSLLRARPVALATPAPVPGAAATVASVTGPTPAAPPPAASASPRAGAGLVVHVLGAVRRPGLVRLPAGARVADAIDRAGGLRRDADPAELNLAQPLADGEQVVVGTRAHPAGEVRSAGAGSSGSGTPGSGTSGSGSPGSGATAGPVAPVDLNRATADQLEQLPGVGPVTAQKILAWRAAHGRFSRPEELQEVDGIGPKTYAQIAPHVTA